MSNAIEGLQPSLVWKYFSAISNIPRGSGNEKAVSQFVLDTAAKLGLEAKRDKHLNVVVKKRACAGKEQVPSLCLQGHLDMVCEKNKDTTHDFLKDPIELVREGNVLRANGTTLGADNGVAVATNLAIMEDTTLVHGPLEFLFTVDEERGLTGANSLKSEFVVSKTLMNLDSEEEGALYVGCSGGRNTLGTWKLKWESVPRGAVCFAVRVRGLKGGHSGLEIDKGRGNSLKLVNRVLLQLVALGVRLSHLEGGNKSNAIPREAEALCFVAKKNFGKAKKLGSQFNAIAKSELATVEPNLEIVIEEMPSPKGAKVMNKNLALSMLQTISALPHGVIKMSADIPGLVETSTNVAIVRTGAKALELTTSQRSSVASELTEILQTVGHTIQLGGGKASHTEGYPGWKPDMNSAILKIARETYRHLTGKESHVKAIHAGLECGIIGEKYPGIDMVSFGPTLEGVHSPDEKIYIDTVEKFWNFLLAILRNVN